MQWPHNLQVLVSGVACTAFIRSCKLPVIRSTYHFIQANIVSQELTDCQLWTCCTKWAVQDGELFYFYIPKLKPKLIILIYIKMQYCSIPHCCHHSDKLHIMPWSNKRIWTTFHHWIPSKTVTNSIQKHVVPFHIQGLLQVKHHAD